MWMLQRLMAHPSAYHVTRLLRLPGRVEGSSVRAALEALSVRHGVLRVRLRASGDGFWQEEVEAGSWRMDWGELAMASGGAPEVLSAERERLFDLEAGPLWRARWWREADGGRL